MGIKIIYFLKCVPYDFLKLKLASESDSAVKTVEKYYLPYIHKIVQQ